MGGLLAALDHGSEDRRLVFEAHRLLKVAPGLISKQALQQKGVRPYKSREGIKSSACLLHGAIPDASLPDPSIYVQAGT